MRWEGAVLKNRKVVLLVLLVVAAAATFRCFGSDSSGPAKAVPFDFVSLRNTPPAIAPDQWMQSVVPASYPRPVSAWQAAERTRFEKILGHAQADVLVVPFQIEEMPLDRAARSLMTAELAQAIANTTKLSVADPYLVARALGDGQRQVDKAAVMKLATELHAKRIVWGEVGHDGRGHFALDIHWQNALPDSADSYSSLQTKSFPSIPFTDEKPPVLICQTLLPAIMQSLGYTTPAAAQAVSTTSPVSPNLPSVQGMLAAAPNPLRDAEWFQVLGQLTPDDASRTRERFFEKSLLAITTLPTGAPEYHALQATALLRLGYRQAALQVLSNPQTAEEKALTAILNGNLTAAKTWTAQIGDKSRRLVAALFVQDMVVSYGGANESSSQQQAQAFSSSDKDLSWLIYRAFLDWNVWSPFSNEQASDMLDSAFSAQQYPGVTMEDALQKLGNAGDPQVAQELSVPMRIQRLQVASSDNWCCRFAPEHFSQLDYLDLLDAVATDNLMTAVSLKANMQGLPDDAITLLDQLDSVYKDYPEATLMRAEAEAALAEKKSGDEQASLQGAAFKHAYNAYYWEQGETPISASALDMISTSQTQPYGHFLNFYTLDYPFRPFYPAERSSDDTQFELQMYQMALDNATWQTQSLLAINERITHFHWQTDSYLQTTKDSLVGRFEGSGEVSYMKATFALQQNDIEHAKTWLLATIKAQPTYWDAYKTLGTLQLEDGDASGAAALFHSYPGFQPGSTENAVYVSNYAFDTAKLFFYSGDMALATPFFTICSQLDTGAGAEFFSTGDLALLSGDYKQADQSFEGVAERYNAGAGYRNHLAIQFAAGATDEPWTAFDTLSTQNMVEVWDAADVGQRRAGMSERDISNWAGQGGRAQVGDIGSEAARYVLRAGITDRLPTAALAPALDKLEHPTWKVHAMGRDAVVRPSTDGRIQYILGPDSVEEKSSLPIGQFVQAQKAPVESELALFADAYRALRLGHDADALKGFQQLTALYDVTQSQQGFVLPYYAYAAARSGDVGSINKLLAGFSPQQQRLDYFLAKAVLAGIAGDMAHATQFLNLANYRHDFINNRAVAQDYAYVELCEWLYQSTKQPQYKSLALDRAQKFQRRQPWYAWTYAVQAELLPDSPARQQAIAMAHNLDPNSERLAQLPGRYVQASIKAYGDKNPFD